MAHVLAQHARVGVPGAKNQDVTDLFDTYLMDLASIAVTSDYRLNAVKEPNYTARVYNAYKDQLRTALDDNTTLLNLLPPTRPSSASPATSPNSPPASPPTTAATASNDPPHPHQPPPPRPTKPAPGSLKATAARLPRRWDHPAGAP
ncbi:hypothetical protein [Streptomyces galbus]|uniref:hypothetical protein n=1 Tax=Streptomyces galbus TaxID=33898 RepID=UPI003EBC17C6